MRFYELLREYNEQRLIHDFGDKLVKRSDDANDTPEAIIQAIAKLDPTPNKELTFWLAMNYANERIARWEDIASRAVPALLKFKALLRKPNLTPPLPVRDMNQIKGLSALEDITEQYAEKESVSNREQSSAEEQKFYDTKKAILFYNDAQIKVVIPRSKAAAQFFGKGTRWCTAAKDDNRFAEYNDDGPLYIVILKGTNAKYQFQWESDQFMDAKDNDIDPRFLALEFPVLFKIFAPISKKNNSLIFNLHPTEEEQYYAVIHDGSEIRYIDDPLEAIELAAVKEKGASLQYIYAPSEKVQMAAIKEAAYAIQYIPHPSEAIQMTAVKMYTSAIKYIMYPSEAVQLYVVENNPTDIQHINNPSLKVQLAAVSKKGKAIIHLERPCEAVQIAAVQQYPSAICYINMPCEAAQLEAVKRDAVVFQYISNPTKKVKALQKKLWGNK